MATQRDNCLDRVPDWDGTLDECKEPETANWAEECTLYPDDRTELAVTYPGTDWEDSAYDPFFNEDRSKRYPNAMQWVLYGEEGYATAQLNGHEDAHRVDNESIFYYDPVNADIADVTNLKMFSTDIYKLIDSLRTRYWQGSVYEQGPYNWRPAWEQYSTPWGPYTPTYGLVEDVNTLTDSSGLIQFTLTVTFLGITAGGAQYYQNRTATYVFRIGYTYDGMSASHYKFDLDAISRHNTSFNWQDTAIWEDGT